MAIAQICKIHVVAHQALLDALVARLHALGVMDIAFLEDGDADARPATHCDPFSQREKVDLSDLKGEMLKLRRSIGFLSQFEEKAGLLASLVDIRPFLTEEQCGELLGKFDVGALVKTVLAKEDELQECQSAKKRLFGEREVLLPWSSCDVPIEEFAQLEKARVILGMISVADQENFVRELDEASLIYELEEINHTHDVLFVALGFLRNDSETIIRICKVCDFNSVAFPYGSGTVTDMLASIDQQLQGLEQREKEIGAYLRDRKDDVFKLKVHFDQVSISQQRREVRRNFLQSRTSSLLKGWIAQSDISALRSAIAEEFKEVDMMVSAPEVDDQPPVLLENKKMVRPYEIVTTMYGLPSRGQIDPTPFLMPFFFVFFGLCLTDAGYGLVLFVLGLFLYRKLPFQETSGRFLKLLMGLGFSTVVLGALFGGWFGNAVDLLPGSFGVLKEFKDGITVLDPLTNPRDSIVFIGIALGLGMMQVFLGMFLNFTTHVRQNALRQAFFVDLSWIILVGGCIVLFGKAFFGLPVPGAMAAGIKLLLLWSAGAIVFFSAQEIKNPFGRILQGLYNLYGITGYFSDILSYFRLFALGLATAGIAIAINSIVQVIVTELPVIGFIVGFIVFVVMHIYNIMINAMGAFVHTARLQFLEFFSKFYQGGGRVFAPFRVETKYITLDGR